MRKDDAVAYFGSQYKLAKFLGISRQAVSRWGEIVPEGIAYKLQDWTKGKLKVDYSLYDKAPQ